MERVRRQFNKIIAFLWLGVATLLSGLFFVGCGESPADKLTLTADKSIVEVYAGESESVTFTIGNYTSGIDTSLSFALVDSTVSSKKSEHAELEVLSREETQTTVKITGVSGGTTTLVAVTNEGHKPASVTIKVRQYSSKFEIKNDSLLYVSKSTPFTPSEKLFEFDESATERKVSFHFADSLNKANDNNAFVRAELVADEYGAYTVVFYQEDGYAVVLDEYKNLIEGTGISIIAKYYNPQTDKTESQKFALTVLYGFDESVKIEAYDGDGAVENIELVPNDTGTATENWRSKKFKVKVPHVENFEGDKNVVFDCDYDKNGSIWVENVINSAESTPNYDVYDFEVGSTAVESKDTSVVLRLYYKINGISYADSGDSSVEQQFEIPVSIRIAPTNIVVNSIEQSSADNQYNFYNHYDGDYGWKEFKVNVFSPECSFDHVLMTFDSDLIVKYKNKTYVAGVTEYQLKIDDVGQVIYIRGASDAVETAEPKQITFEVVSKYARQTFSYKCNYSILTGATILNFDNPNTSYEYNPKQDKSGIFVSTSSVDGVVFTHLVTDNDFGYVNATYYDGEASAARVAYDGKEVYEPTAYGKIVKLKIVPYKVGIVTYKITLDNGVSKLLTFRVIDTFDNLSVNLAGAGNDGVQSTEKTTDDEGLDQLNIVIQNSTLKEENGNTMVAYGKYATVVLDSSNGGEVFDNVTYTIENATIVTISSDEKSTARLTTSGSGEGAIEFKATGTAVEDFKIATVVRSAKVNLVSFVPVYSLNVKDEKTKTNANNVSLYVGDMVSDASLQTAKFSIEVDPENEAYGFYAPDNDAIENEGFEARYVYWTVNGANPYLLDNSQASNGRMIFGKVYKIGPDPYNYFGTFDTTTNTFTINKNMKQTFSFTMFASLRQYGSSKYFSVTIKGETYDFVERIYTNLGENSIKFSPLTTSYDIGVFLNPANATDTKVIARFVSNNTDSNDPVLISNTESIVEISSGINLVSAILNPEVLENAINGTLSGVLQIIPNAWYVNGSIIAGYENAIVKILVEYEDGSESNPYSISSAEDVIAIGKSAAAMRYHYKISTTVDLSAYSSELPLGGDRAFSGSIIGSNDASIIGLKINNGTGSGAYGLFNSVSGKIENLTLKGSINIENKTTNKIVAGLLCSKLETGASLKNITCYVSGGKISATEVIFGGLVGENCGEISDMCVVFEDYVNIVSTLTNVTSDKTLQAGGIAGASSGNILGRKDISKRFGIAAYSVYALIRVGDSESVVPPYGQAAAVAASQDGGKIENILAGGVIFAKQAGGLVETFAGNSTEINDLTIRTQIRGQKVGLIAVKANENALNADFSNIKIQATDDGESISIYASMYVKIQNTDSDELGVPTTNPPDLDKILIAESTYLAAGNTTFASYVDRSNINIELNEIDFDFTTDEYFGDVIFVAVNNKTVKYTYSFAKQTTSVDVKPNEKNGFKKLVSSDGGTSNVIFAYYFEAAGYYGENGFTTEQVYNAQNILDYLNHVKYGDKFYPIQITGTDVSISSNSSLVEISAGGDLYIKGAGLAELEVSSLLNKKQNEKIYLYIINYFNVDSYQSKLDSEGNTIPAAETGIFTLGELVLGDGSEFNVYSNSSVSILISPSYKYDLFEMEINGDMLDVSISSTGLVKIGNSIIQLSKSRVVSAALDEDDTLSYGTATTFRDGITFTKNGVVGKDQFDNITLIATMSQQIDGKTYALEITKLANVKINYYEGAKAIKSLAENYVLSSSITVEDTYLIDSDDNEDEIEESMCKFVDAETGESVELFNLALKKTTDLTYSAKISVNKESSEFVNRFNENIYKDYVLKLKAESNDQYLRTIPITLVQENIDVIAFTNYKIISAKDGGQTVWGLEEYNNIVPGSRGILSVSLSPMDADFDYLQITNNQINTLEGASQATFVIGKWDSTNGFVAIKGAEFVDGGVRISKANLVEAFEETGFMGQVYVRYIFSNQDVEDKTPVGVDITVLQSGGSISRTAQYNFYKKDDVSVSLKGFTNKQYVARGLEYELDVKAIGYDENTITLTSDKPQQASIIERDGNYYLKITNDAISYGDTGLVFKITLSASKTDDSGETMTEVSELDLTILEYVINFDNSNASNYDIINGVENGTMNIAVGDKKQLAISFDGLIEYNHENGNIEAMVNSFLNELAVKGTWMIYTDLNQNTPSGESSLTLPIDEGENSTKTVIPAVGEFNIKYLKISDLALTTIQSHDPQIAERYFFTYKANYNIKNGKYTYAAGGDRAVSSKFKVYSYMRGSEESPNPVTTYKEFLAMEAGGYYIQLADIRVPADEFVPLNTAIRYFDGNSYKFIFDDSKYDLGTTSSVGLFGTVSSNTVLKNITIQTGSDEVGYVEFNSTSTSTVNFGFVAGVNNGTITNAQIVNAGVSASLTFKNTPSSEGYYLGGIAGQNTGYITHSQSYMSIDSCISMGGIVGANQGTIASSMFKDGKMINTSIYNDVFGVGGIAATNSEKAVIITSYSSGVVKGDCVYSKESDGSAITSSVPVGGFVYDNEGTIRDCYSNIPIVTTSRSAGFAFNNNGKILRCFSTSQIVNDFSATNYYFAGEGIGSFESCYYISGDINKTLSPLTHAGVEKLEYSTSDGSVKNEFGIENLAQKFADYSYTEAPVYNSVWFYSDGNESTVFASQQFAGGRLELTSANIIARSKKEHIKTTVNADGIASYIYATASGSPDDGSVFNPYVIYSPETMEGYFVTGNKIASGNYRLVCPVDYSSVASNYTNLFRVEMKGNFEANDMEISGITLTSNDQLAYAGLFGSVVGSSSDKASIMNFNFTPKEVVFNNASEVGAIAGRIQNANLYNINVYGASSGDEVDANDELATVTGKNVVGGVVGLAKDGYKIKNVHSLIGAFALNIPYDKSEIDYETEGSDYSSISFAGGIAGYLAGTGSVSDVSIDRAAINIIGGKIGFVFGGMAKNATAKNIYLKLNASMQMKPYRYAGFIAGEIKGKLQNAYVYGYSTFASGTENLITLKPYTAVAVGGITGLLNGGDISMTYVSQGIAIGNLPTASVEVNTVNYVGGIVGLVKGGGNKLNQVLATGDLSAKNVLGGLVGQVSANASLLVSEAAFRANNLLLEGQNAAPAVGGLVGAVGENANVTILDSYSQADITMKTYSYSTPIKANFGGIIGAQATGNGTIIRLENIYTTSIYNITVEDKSSTNATGMVYDGWVPNTSGGREYKDGYYLDGNGKKEGEIEDENSTENGEANKVKNDLRKINYSLKQATASCTNVYNSSIYSMPNSLGGKLERGYTTLYARKFGDISIEVNQNEFGVDLYDAIKDDLTTDIKLLVDVEYTIGKAFNNLFGGNSIWKTSVDSNSYLAFEEKLELIP